jgi:hypothetical protein
VGIETADEQVEAMGLSGRSEKKPGFVALHWRGMRDKEVREMRDKVRLDCVGRSVGTRPARI